MEKPQKTSSELDDELKAVLPPSDKLMENSLAWMRTHKSKIAVAFALFAIFFLVLGRQQSKAQTQWDHYNSLKASWFEKPSERARLIDELAKLTSQHPDWLGSWKGLFLQSGLTLDREAIVEKWQNEPPSRLIEANSSFSQALDEASALALALRKAEPQSARKRIDQWLSCYGSSIDGKEESSPMAFLLQLSKLELLSAKALMAQKLQDSEAEKQAWLEWLKAMDLSSETLLAGSAKASIRPIYLPWLQAHGQGRLTPLDYVKERFSLLATPSPAAK